MATVPLAGLEMSVIEEERGLRKKNSSSFEGEVDK
jgi:hypothetical protein